MSRPETTDTDHGHPYAAKIHGQTRPPRTPRAHLLVKTTDTTTDATDAQDHGHHWGGLYPPVGPVSAGGGVAMSELEDLFGQIEDQAIPGGCDRCGAWHELVP